MIWEGETVPDYQSGPNVITRVLLRGRQRVRGRAWKMVTLLAWRWKRGPWASRSWKIQGNKGTQPCWHLDFSTVRPHVKLLTQNRNIIVLLFKPLDLWFAYKFKQILNERLLWKWQSDGNDLSLIFQCYLGQAYYENYCYKKLKFKQHLDEIINVNILSTFKLIIFTFN